MEIKNLRDEDVNELTDLVDKLKETNPEIESRVFKMKDVLEEAKDREIQLQEVLDKLDALDRKLDLIFGTHVLIKGQFMQRLMGGE